MRRVAGVSPLQVHCTTWVAALALVALCAGAALYVGDRAASSLATATLPLSADPWTREIAARVAKLPLVLLETPNRAKKQAREAVKPARPVPEIAAAPPSSEPEAATPPLKPEPVALKPDDPAPRGAERQAPQNEAAALPAQTGRASWYALPGRTASGEKMNHAAMTAAHPSLPFGTKVRVVNLKNGRDVVVRINDRGPFAKNRIIDVSKAAAAALGMINTGVARVKVSPVENEVASNDDQPSSNDEAPR